MSLRQEFADILTADEPLGPMTRFGVGGPAELVARPRDPAELSRLVARCNAEQTPFRILGGGTNILIPDDGVAGVVIRLEQDAFRTVEIIQTAVTAGAGVSLAELINRTCGEALSGLEDLIGVPGTVGGAVLRNAGGKAGDIGSHVTSAYVLDHEGNLITRRRPDLRFSYRHSNLEGTIVLSAEFKLIPDKPEDLDRRIKKLWIASRASEPPGFESACQVFRDPRAKAAAELIDAAGMRHAHVGGAEICAHDPRFIIVRPGAISRDVRRLIDLVLSKVDERTGEILELEINPW